jgi:hypothetical protein
MLRQGKRKNPLSTKSHIKNQILEHNHIHQRHIQDIQMTLMIIREQEHQSVTGTPKPERLSALTGIQEQEHQNGLIEDQKREHLIEDQSEPDTPHQLQ